MAFSDNLVPAFSIAAVLLGIWQNHPAFGRLFLAHLYKRCPYAIPAHWPKKAGQDNTAYLRRMGYAPLAEGNVEEKDKFLQKMEGCIKLYSAVIVTPAPYADKVPVYNKLYFTLRPTSYNYTKQIRSKNTELYLKKVYFTLVYMVCPLCYLAYDMSLFGVIDSKTHSNYTCLYSRTLTDWRTGGCGFPGS